MGTKTCWAWQKLALVVAYFLQFSLHFEDLWISYFCAYSAMFIIIFFNKYILSSILFLLKVFPEYPIHNAKKQKPELVIHELEVIHFSSYTRRRQWHPTPVLLPEKIPWTEEPGGLQSMGLLRVGHDWATSLSLFTFMHWRRKWQPTPVFLPGEPQGRGSLVGCRLWGRTESDTTEAT